MILFLFYLHVCVLKESSMFIASAKQWFQNNYCSKLNNNNKELKKPKLLDEFQQSIFKGQVRNEGFRVCDQLVAKSLVDDSVIGWCHRD